MTAPPDLSGIADTLLDWTLDRPATLGGGRLICVDGPAGSGKTTLGAALARGGSNRLGERVELLHMDDLFRGWSGMAAGMEILAHEVVRPLQNGLPATYCPFDWAADRPSDELRVDPAALLVVEGVGSGAAAIDEAVTCLVWIEAPLPLRLERGMTRDGEQMREHWLRWQQEEDEMFARERIRERADAFVDSADRDVVVRFR